jgi:hypothetical protein
MWMFALATFFASANYAAAREICEQWWQGNTRHWTYCDPPYICDRENPRSGKCKPGPELQRQLEESEQRLIRSIQMHQRVLNRSIRRGWSIQIGNEIGVNDQRAPECAVLNFGDGPAQFCVGDAERNVTGPIDYGAPSDSRRVPSSRLQTVARGMQNRAQRYAARAGRKMAIEVRNTVDALVAGGSIEDAADYLDKLTQARALTNANDPRVAMLDEAITYGRRKVGEARASENPAPSAGNAADAVPAPEVATQASGPRPTPRDEALCSFLLDVSQDRPGRPSAPVPESCDNYRDFLSSLAPTPPRDYYQRPIRIRTEDDEDIQKFIEDYTKLGEQQSNLAVPPGFGGN